MSARVDETKPVGALVPAHRRARASALIALMLAGKGFVTWGLDLHLIAFLRDYGLTATAAVALAAAKGPFTLVARVTELTLAGRVSALAGTLVGAGLLVASLLLALVWREGWQAAALFLGLHAMGAGLLAVSRATLPLAVLGAEGYATTLGKIALPTQIVYALAPMIFTILIERLGGQGAVAVATLASLMSLGALLLLRRELRMVAPSLP